MKRFGIKFYSNKSAIVALEVNADPAITLTLLGFSVVLGVYYEVPYTDFVPKGIEPSNAEVERLYKIYLLEGKSER